MLNTGYHQVVAHRISFVYFFFAEGFYKAFEKIDVKLMYKVLMKNEMMKTIKASTPPDFLYLFFPSIVHKILM